jgi:M6 family metalloprotease-like protein
MLSLTSRRSLIYLALASAAVLAPLSLRAQTEGSKKTPDLAHFKTVATAVQAKIAKSSSSHSGTPAYLGILGAIDAKGNFIVSDVDDQSPAARGGILAGDILTQIDDSPIRNVEMFRGILQTKSAGADVKLTIRRKKEMKELTATLGATSRVMHVGQQRAIMGVQLEEVKDGDGTAIKQVTTGLPADKAGLKAGDIILKINDRALTAAVTVADVLSEKKPGDSVTLLVKRQGADKDKTVELKLAAESQRGSGGRGGAGGGWDTRAPSLWKKDTYRLAVVGIEYPDVKHNSKVTAANWEESLFSNSTYKQTSATGQKVFGSMLDYYHEQSFGKLKVQGKFLDFVQVAKKRAEYAQATGQNKTQLLSEALDKLIARDGKNALQDFDGIFFLYAGDRVQTNRGGLYWPHKATFTHQGKRWPYFIVGEGGQRMSDISVICHEFGHMLGLPDLYARPENPGSEGVGVWCAMSNQVGGGKPQHFSAWSKEQLGWIEPAILDPTVKQKLILAPIESSPKECFKVLARPDGSEYFLLENRKKQGFDQSLPAEGLLIWRVVQNKPILEESHGIEGPAGPRVFLNAVPFPSTANTAFTPYTTPSSRAQLGGGLPVHITNIRRLPDGRITFYIGYEYY